MTKDGITGLENNSIKFTQSEKQLKETGGGGRDLWGSNKSTRFSDICGQ